MNTFKFSLICLGLIIFGIGIAKATHNNNLLNLLVIILGSIFTSAGISIED